MLMKCGQKGRTDYSFDADDMTKEGQSFIVCASCQEKCLLNDKFCSRCGQDLSTME